MYTVSQLATMSGVSVRAIQHYHRIGLLKPSKVGENGYRYYNEKKILELQQILFFKELDFSLSEIREIINNPAFSIEKSLSKQKELIFLKLERLNNIIDLIDKTLENQKGENEMSGKDYFEEISEEKVNEYTKRAKEEYGEKVVNESIKNVKKAYNNDYKQMQKEFEDWLDSLRVIMDTGHDSVEAQELMAEWYKKINRIFACDLQTFSGLGMLYRDNDEFAINFKKVHVDMPEFVCDAIQYFCSNKE